MEGGHTPRRMLIDGTRLPLRYWNCSVYKKKTKHDRVRLVDVRKLSKQGSNGPLK